jgi:hypothetical protein
MGTKTISLHNEAYERLRRARRNPGESFSEVVMRAVWPDAPLTGGDYLALVRERGPIYAAEEIDRVDEASASDLPPQDKWPTA